ncbi:uncharacterized protein LOC106011114 [Aplysia californica]|uniref:Uncharacterized protein LOC106011114 n=1 Tax=Aplysia californica TaxID=6500 RepID=A0ABM0ZV17_APLCA|nr:uncharacterized protein LOC106011114 [Aplysia californica]
MFNCQSFCIRTYLKLTHFLLILRTNEIVFFVGKLGPRPTKVTSPRTLVQSLLVVSTELLVSRRLGADQGQGKSSLDDSFIRSASMRMSNRARTMSSLLQVTSAVARQPLLRSSWTGSSEDVSEDGRRTTPTPPGSGNPSPMSARRKHSKDVDLMPPPTNAMLGRRPRYSDRSKSSSRESLTSSKSSLKNDENQNMMRSESEPNFAEGNVA